MNKKTIESLKEYGLECYGCGSCKQVCPNNAIAMKYDEEGFLQPCLNSELCSNCNQCVKVCPAINKHYKNSNTPSAFLFQASDEVLWNSSSGRDKTASNVCS